MARHRYSAHANSDVITFLVNNGIYFVFQRGIVSYRRKVFFVATPEDVQTLTAQTGWHVDDEDDGWDFEGWDAIE